MPVPMPDALADARRQADVMKNAGYDMVERSVERVLLDAPWLDRAALLEGAEAFHRERMAKVPAPARYPESPAWVAYVTAFDSELQRILGLSGRQIAVLRSLSDYLTFRAGGRARAQSAEKCRVLWVPETDRGALHIKNVDDPAPPHWAPDRARPATLPCSQGLIWDGVGSGLHIDDEPDETFPLPIMRMYRHHADDVPGAIQFLTRYSPFFGGMNFVLHDDQRRSVAIEKCSRTFIEVFPPDPLGGFTHVSGMACRDPNSPQGRHQKAKRDAYRARHGLPADGTDATFWAACDRAERMLADGIRRMAPRPSCDAIFSLFTTPWPKGLCKTGAKMHPQQGLGEYTLMTHGSLLDERAYYRWARDENLRFPDQPLVFTY